MFAKAIVTGSSGFVGSYLSSYLSSLGYQVLGIDNRQPNNSNHFSDKYEFQECDLLDLHSLKYIFQRFKPDVIFHLAARTDLNEKKNIQGYASNIQGVENLVLAIRETPSIKRGIFTSSQLVCKAGYVPENSQDYCPNTLYGESKVLTEKIIRENDGGQIEWCIVRPTTVWGEGMSPHYQTFLNLINKGRYFHISNRPLYKSYSYIGNTIYQYLKIMEASAENIHQKTFYLADYTPISLRNWTNLIQEEMEASPIPTYPENIVKIIAQIGDLINNLGFANFPFNSFRLNNILTEYIFDLAETEKVCGLLPYTIEEGVCNMVSWLKNKDKV